MTAPDAEQRMNPTHPEAWCQECDRPNAVWFAPNKIWNAAVPDRVGILCPACFANAYETATGERPVWRFAPEPH